MSEIMGWIRELLYKIITDLGWELIIRIQTA